MFPFKNICLPNGIILINRGGSLPLMEPATIYNKTVSSAILAGLISRVKEKRELVHLDDAVCREYIVKYLMMHGKVLAKLSEARDFSAIQRSREMSNLIKSVRENVRLIYGVYQTEDADKIRHYLDKLEKDLKNKPIESTKEDHDRLLRLNLSTAERLPFYEQFFSDIFAITDRPKRVLDLACGLNPMAWPYHQFRDMQYTAAELNEPDVRHLQRYFDITESHTGIDGKAITLDLTQNPVDTVEVDVCFLLKVLDLLDPKRVELIVTSLHCRWIVASFPTKTITEQEMRFKRRAGFQKMLRRLGMTYQTLTYENELVYIIKKSHHQRETRGKAMTDEEMIVNTEEESQPYDWNKVEFKPAFIQRYSRLTDWETFKKYSLSYLRKAIRVNTLKATVAEIKKRLSPDWKLTPVPWCKESFWIEGKRRDFGNLPEHILGYIYIQDPASMIPPIVLDPQPGEDVLDICAAPGSKTTQIGQYMKGQGLLVANDIDDNRIASLGLNIQRCGLTNGVITKMHGHWFKNTTMRFDRILVDAPCSGTGTIRKSIRCVYDWSPNLVRRVAGQQRSLLETAFGILKEGGTLVYSTCTLEPEENEGNVDWLLSRFPNAALQRIELDIKHSPAVEAFENKQYTNEIKKCLRIWPQDNDTEGFFVAKIKKE